MGGGRRYSERFKSKKCEESPVSIKQGVIWFLIIFLGHLFYWFAYFPGGFNLDALGQWDQAHGMMQLNNWHPVLTTGIYWLLTRIEDSLAFCIGVQIVVFSVTMVFILLELGRRNIRQGFMWAIVLFVAVNPAIAMNNICLIKDVPFAILVCWTFWCYLKIDRTQGMWLQSRSHLCITGIILLMLTLVRHNAIFFVIPLIFLMFLIYRKQRKYILEIAVVGLGILLFIEGPVFSVLKIEQHNNMVGEAVGVPMAAMANALIDNPKECPVETREFLLDIAGEREWKEHYITGEWDSCKWEFGGVELLKSESLGKIISLLGKTAIKCPDEVYSSIRENTRVVWQVIGECDWSTWIYIEKNEFGIREDYNKLCRGAAETLRDISEKFPMNMISWEVGPAIVLFFLCVIGLIQMNQRQSCIFIISLLYYDFMTMCLLCGPSFRYFYVNLILVLPILAMVFGGDYAKEI